MGKANLRLVVDGVHRIYNIKLEIREGKERRVKDRCNFEEKGEHRVCGWRERAVSLVFSVKALHNALHRIARGAQLG